MQYLYIPFVKAFLNAKYKLILLAIIACFSLTTAFTQSPVNYVEYYVDQDPGIGKAIPVTVTAGTTITNATFTVDVASLNLGIHILASRARTASGVWSMGHYWFIFKPYIPITPAAVANISKVEYFIDKDPGIGLGTAVTIANGSNDLQDVAFTINPSTLSKGVHIVGSRSMNSNGVWSMTNFWLFNNAFSNTPTPAAAPNITAVEYFVDQDPGVGKATPVSVTASTDIVDANFSANIGSLGSGTHFIGTRAKDANGSWSLTNYWLFVKPFTNIAPATQVNVTALEYYLDYDPGYGKGIPVTITPSINLTDLTFNADLTGIIPGTHYLVARAKDANGNWSMVNNWQFTIAGTIPTMTTLVSATTLCAGSTVNVGYQISSPIALKSSNQFIAQLSDASGSFTVPTTIGTFASTNNTTSSFTATIPNNTVQGGNYRIRVISTNQSLVGSNNGSGITIYSLPSLPTYISPRLDTTFCQSNVLKLEATNTSGGSYQWLKDNSPITSATSAIYTVNNPTVADAGSYRLRVSNYSSSTCNVTTAPIVISINTNVPATPTVSPSGAIGVCLGNATTLTASTATSYQWLKDGVVIGGATSATYNASVAGTFTVRTGNGTSCFASSSNNAVVTLGLAATKPTIIVGGATTICQGASVNLTSSAFSGNQWYRNGAVVSGQTSTTLSVTQSGFYKTIVSGGGCSIQSDSVEIIVTPYVVPSISLAASLNNAPAGTSITFTATPTNGGTTPQYSFSVNSSVIQTSGLNTYTTSTLTAGAVVGCSMISNAACLSSTTATSNNITINFAPTVATSGRIYHPSGTIIPSVSVRLSNGLIDSTLTNSLGRYSFNLIQQRNYTVTPMKNNDQIKASGVNVLDVLKMQSHILNSALLNSPYKIIAGDVNRDGVISVLDVIMVKRLILGYDTSFSGRLWAFVDSAATFVTPTNPFPYPSSKSYTNITTAQNNQSFIGVKLGDVTQDWVPTAGVNKVSNLKNTVKISYDDAFVDKENNVRLKVKVKDFKQLMGMQFTLAFNADIFEFVRIENKQIPFEQNVNLSNQGLLSFIWADASNTAKTLADGSYIFDIILNKKQNFEQEDVLVNTENLPAIAFNKNFEPIAITKLSGTIINKPLTQTSIVKEAMDVYPNPTKGEVSISINTNIEKRVSLNLFDVNGKIVYQKPVSLINGNNKFQLNLTKQINLKSGIYYLKVSGIDAISMKEILITTE
ncbi:MAG: T9SS type A sorting domain-containing protein [Chitinophagaceae bacterium]